MGGRRQTQIGQSARKVIIPAGQGPDNPRDPPTPPVHPESLDATMKDATLPETNLPMGQGTAPAAGVDSQAAASVMSSQASAQGLGELQKGIATHP